MPSLSGWALRPSAFPSAPTCSGSFLCPRCRAGLCGFATDDSKMMGASHPFLCPRCRAGLCGEVIFSMSACPITVVSMPSLSGWALRACRLRFIRLARRFYALVVGLGFAGGIRLPDAHRLEFLCPRCRAGLCGRLSRNPGNRKARMFLCPRCRAGLCGIYLSECPLRCCFYALVVGLGFAGTCYSKCRCLGRYCFYALVVGLGFAGPRFCLQTSNYNPVSMPSLSGWALRGMPLGGIPDLHVCRPSRHPRRNGSCRQAVSGK
jgi:hypothetical protein